MSNRTKRTYALITTLVAALMIAMTAQASTMTIYNEDCRTVVFNPWPVAKGRVTVKIEAGGETCTEKKVTVGKGKSKTVEVRARGDLGFPCKYSHMAAGTVGGESNYWLEDGSVTCKEDWFDVCQCTKD